MKRTLLPLLVLLASAGVQAADIDVPLNIATPEGKGLAVGSVRITETAYGVLFTPKLTSLSPGIHGFHVHQNASCEPGVKDNKKVAALGAGDHWDPDASGKHLGPYAEGHRGDLPALYVNADGKADYPVLAPRIKTLSELSGHSLMVHVGGDNHSDQPANGGGGDRFACGVISG
ncbi:superoxide dismutase family protein [Biostraticola tofi]|uniref:Superoxide dismutase [Cu-Zn] n=1 Tax=Biostraticola tofi TaxID=466109 RepID=A0A4R3Z1W3_9GAMM|nr:superoxide dismutase family protein [Biostraticola tofi]TCV99753.1 Cu-Zn family superoxide dismutase [Biostraticola tofi]